MTQFHYIARVKFPGSDDEIIVHGTGVRDLGKKLKIHPNTVLNVLFQKERCRTADYMTISRYNKGQSLSSDH